MHRRHPPAGGLGKSLCATSTSSPPCSSLKPAVSVSVSVSVCLCLSLALRAVSYATSSFNGDSARLGPCRPFPPLHDRGAEMSFLCDAEKRGALPVDQNAFFFQPPPGRAG